MAAITQNTTIVAEPGEWSALMSLVNAFVAPEGISVAIAVNEGQLTVKVDASVTGFPLT